MIKLSKFSFTDMIGLVFIYCGLNYYGMSWTAIIAVILMSDLASWLLAKIVGKISRRISKALEVDAASVKADHPNYWLFSAIAEHDAKMAVVAASAQTEKR